MDYSIDPDSKTLSANGTKNGKIPICIKITEDPKITKVLRAGYVSLIQVGSGLHVWSPV
jgi:hypothetical protein